MADDKDEVRMTFKMKVYTFLDNTTFHGMRYISDTAGNLVRRFLWFLVVGLAFGLFTYIVVNQILLYLEHLKTVNIDIITPDRMLFPAVTVCNQNFIRTSVAVDNGLYDSLNRDFKQLKAKIRTVGDMQECRDKFIGYTNTSLQGERKSDTIIIGVTSDVCQKLCIHRQEVACNGLLYDATQKVCTLTKYLMTSGVIQVVPRNGTDYLRRVRCPNLIDMRCSFEANMCAFVQDVDDDAEWKRDKVSKLSQNTGPDNDHTSGAGYYVFLHVDQDQKASFSSPLISAPDENERRCVEFYYHMEGRDQGELNVWVRYGDDSRELVWQRTGSQGEEWRRGFLRINADLFYLQFEGIGTKGIRDYIAVDDIRVAPCNQFASDCKRHKSGADYMGTVSVTSAGDACKPWADIRSDMVLNPLHFPNESLEASMNYCRNPGSTESLGIPWCFYGSAPGEYAECDIPYCECMAEEFMCDNEKCVSRDRLCDGGNDCGDGSDEGEGPCHQTITCGFEDNFLCGYKYESSSILTDFKWQRHTKSTESFGTGPIMDYTEMLPEGGYVYTDATIGVEGDQAFLMSPTFANDTVVGCFRFAYHIYGEHAGSLNLSVSTNADRYRQLWVVSAGGGGLDKWQTVNVTLNHPEWDLENNRDSLKFVFTATRGNGTRGDMALDGTIYTSGVCPGYAEGCADGEFQCKNGRCIPSKMECDGTDNCYDATDEGSACADLECTFDGKSVCGYTQTSNYKVKGVGWTRVNQTTYTVQDGDMKYTTIGEKYLRSSADLVGKAGVVNTLYSGWVTLTNDSCATYLRKAAKDLAGVLKVYVETRVSDTERDSELLQVHVRDTTPNWVKERVQLRAQNSSLRLRFDAISIYVGSAVLIDNVALEPGECDLSYKSINCSFEDTRLCGYQIGIYGDFTWTRVKDPEIGYQAGYVLATDHLALSDPNTTFVTTPVYEFRMIHCLRFNYNMTGVNPGEFAVFRNNDGYSRRLFVVRSDQGPVWHSQDLELAPGNASIVFQAIRGYEDSSHLRIDAIWALPGRCGTGTCIPNTEFRCDNGRCVKRDRICDGLDDCGDMSDEVGDCNVDCTLDPKGELYSGYVDVTMMGRECLPWPEITDQGRPIQVFPDFTADTLFNRCRNPGGLRSRPWCYTGDSEWGLCDIPKCVCRRNQFRCSNGNCVAASVRCDGRDDCGDRSDELQPICTSANIACEFEDVYMCGYVPDTDTWPFVWHWGKKNLGTDLRPVMDTGYYVYAYSKTAKRGAHARIRSPEMTLTEDHCLTLMYLLSRSITKNLKIYLQRKQGVLNLLDEVRFQAGAIWFSRYYTVPSGTYSLVLEAELTDNREVTAVDNIRLIRGRCANSDLAQYHCVHQPSQLDYTGSLNTTSKGPCLPWDSDAVPSVVRHQRFFPDTSLRAAGASCRNPERKVKPYCYIAKDQIALCEIGQADLVDCKPDVCSPTRCTNGRCFSQTEWCNGKNECGDGSDELRCDQSCRRSHRGEFYSGAVYRASDGTPCDSWSSVYNHTGILTEFKLMETSLTDASNYCRNPDYSEQGPWCYTNEGTKRMQCDIPTCQEQIGCDERFQFQCQNGTCISRKATCDGKNDCLSGEDELQICERSRFEIAKEKCRYTISGSEYIGTLNVTASGLPCDRWDTGMRNLGHEHFPGDGGLSQAENYCRNPPVLPPPDSRRNEPWCYINDTAWEYCHVPVCDCFMDTLEYEYIGSENKTKTGLDCLDWSEVVAAVVADLPDITPEAAGPSCRNSDWSVPYCYTHLPDAGWEDCQVNLCPGALEARGVTCSFDYDFKCGYTSKSSPGLAIAGIEANKWVHKGSPYKKDSGAILDFMKSRTDLCFHNSTLGTTYRGVLSETKSGLTCQRWDAQYPHMFELFDEDFPEKNRSLAENYCRSPRIITKKMWCYTTDPEVEKENCSVPRCQDSMMLSMRGDLSGEAELYSPYFVLEEVSCLQFKYFLYDLQDIPILTVISEDESGNRRYVWNQVGNETAKFQSVAVELRHLPGRQRVIFVSKQGSEPDLGSSPETPDSYSTAIDDVILTNGTCVNLGSCSDEEFHCTNGRCISSELVCNGYDDCKDNSDEQNCTCMGYRCPDGRCISGNLVSDGHSDCLGGADETNQAVVNLGKESVEDPEPAQKLIRLSKIHNYEEYPKVDLNGERMVDFFKMGAHQREDFIHSCTYNNMECDEDDVTQIITDFGICYTFNNDDSKYISFRGSNYGLKLTLNIESYEYMEGLHPAKGIKAQLHRPHIRPPVTELGFNLAPGFSYSINVEVTNVTRLPEPWGKCEKGSLKPRGSYDRQQCQLECATKRSLEVCKCVAPHMSDTGESHFCDFRDYMDCYLLDSFNTSSSSSCVCPEQCEEFTYQNYISFGSLTDRSRDDIMSGNISHLQARVKNAARANDLKDADAYVKDLVLFKAMSGIHDEVLTVADGFTKPDNTNMTQVKYNAERWEAAIEKYFTYYQDSYMAINASLVSSLKSRLEEYTSLHKQLLYFIDGIEYKLLQLSLVLNVGHLDEFVNSTLSKTVKLELIQQLDLLKAFMVTDFLKTELRKCLGENNPANSEFVNYTRSIKSQLVGGITKFKIDQILDQIKSETDTLILQCVTKHIGILRGVMKTFEKLAPDNTVKARFDQILMLRQNLYARELRIPIIHIMNSYMTILNDFLEGNLSKSNMMREVVDEIVPLMETQMVGILKQIQAEFVQPFSVTFTAALNQLKNDYNEMLAVLRAVRPYSSNDTVDLLLEQLKIWKRPLVILTVSTWKFVGEHADYYGQRRKYAGLPDNQLKDLIDEHVTVFREPISISLSMYSRHLADIQNNITNLVFEMKTLDAQQQMRVATDETNENFIQENFMTVEFYFAQLTIRVVEDRKSLSLETLFGTIGGYMGLLIGGSVISILEILDLFMMYFCGHYWVKKQPTYEPEPEPDPEMGWPEEKDGIDNEAATSDGD